MNKFYYHLGIISLAAACGLQLLAKPAKPGLLTVPTVDGRNITVRLVGDESFHQYFTEDGYPLMERDGQFYYCDLDADGNYIDSGIVAGEVADRSQAAKAFIANINKDVAAKRVERRSMKVARKTTGLATIAGADGAARAQAQNDDNLAPPYERGYGLFPEQRFPAYGDQKAIVILVEYTDVKFNSNYRGGVTAADYFTRMLNEDDFADYGATGSAAQFFRANSGNHFRPEFDVYGPITLAHNQSYYGGNDLYGNDLRPEEMVIEACQQLDATVDFADYDRNHDGLVDNIFIFYAGRGEASGGSANTVWPHSWNMVSAGYPDLYFDGVRVHTYGCSNEWEAGRPDGVGTFVHEFSHVMGLPDLYATRYTYSFTPSSWSALDYGPYNNDGMTPPNYGAFERYALGWVKPREVDRALSVTLEPVSDNVCGIIRTGNEKEFFLLENRQQEGWDEYVPGHGMLVWHVDYNDAVWSRNEVNNDPSHQYVDIEEADNTQSESSRNGDAFPGASHKTEFTPTTKPSMTTWAGQTVNFPLTNIAESNGLITFDILGGGMERLSPISAQEATDIHPAGFTLNWDAPDEGNDVILNVWEESDAAADSENAPAKELDARNYLPGFRNRNMGDATSVVIDGLQPAKVFHFSVKQSSGWVSSEESVGTAFTGDMTIEYVTAEATEASDVTSDSFTANWEATKDAVGYEVSLFEMIPGDPFTDEVNFDLGNKLPGDWTTNAGNSYSLSAYVGKSAPSLRLAASQYVKSPVYQGDVKSVKFWSRGSNTSEGDCIKVTGYTSAGSIALDSVAVVKAIGGQTTEISAIPEGVRQISLQFDRKGSTGALALDDIEIAYGLQYDAEPIEKYTACDAGAALSYTFTGLEPVKMYGYRVRATDGELFSRPSKIVTVTTGTSVGVDKVVDSAFAVSVAGLEVAASAADEIIVADYTGAVVARGSYRVTLPRAGLYIVSVPSRNYVKKIIIR
ncbi:MAG: M6 family metalloprotease domain-containing protein [Muribaculaceae bacterium]|nr:M6 family metalloprotease domain-containing protein [Muribaculaceae bacterium]